MLSIALILPVYADDSNGQSGDGEINSAAYAFYRTNEWGWRVSLYVAKDIGYTENEYKGYNLENNFYLIGTVTIKNNSLKITSKTYSGFFNKIQLKAKELYLENNRTVWQYSCPAPPVVCSGNIDTVNAFFLNNELVLDLLDKIAVQYGLDSRNELVEELIFTYHYEDGEGSHAKDYTGAELGVNHIFPYSTRSNYVPWVIVYEPMICTYLADSDVSVFLTATEYAMAQGTLYNWHTVRTDRKDYCTYCGNTYPTGRLYPQCVQSMAFRTLPSSVTLRESWFGYETMDPVGENESVSLDDIISKGGWGMGYLSTMALPEIRQHIEWGDLVHDGDLGVKIVYPEAGYTAGADVVTSVIITNYSDHVLPDDGVSVSLTVRDSETDNIIFLGSRNTVSLPEYEDTYVWFAWNTAVEPEKNLRISADIYSGSISDTDPRDNTDSIEISVGKTPESATPTPGFDDKKPSGYGSGSEPAEVRNTSEWHFWDFDDYVFSKYEITVLSGGNTRIAPDPDIASTVRTGDDFTVRSGYGYETVSGFLCTAEVRKTYEIAVSAGEYSSMDEPVNSERILSLVSGSITVPAEAHALFPEFLWSENTGGFSSLENMPDGSFVFYENPDADGDRIHYMPLWYPDGKWNYYVYTVFSGVWTPGGELHSTVRSNAFSVSGSLYDDWYVGRE